MISTMLVENMRCPADDELVSENSISMHISHEGKNVIFDLGSSNKCLDNAIKMGIDLTEVDAVVISHGHKDHAGGLARFLQINEKAKVYIKKEAFEKHFLNYRFYKRNISMDKMMQEEMRERFVLLESDTEILPGFHILTKFPKKYEIFDFNKIYLKEENKIKVKDDFEHELSLALKLEKGLVVFSGCSHTNILNVLEAVNKKFPKTKIKAIMGGLHLVAIPLFMEVKESQIIEIGKGILSYDVGITYVCHCTSRRGYRILKKVMHEKVAYFFTGSQIEI